MATTGHSSTRDPFASLRTGVGASDRTAKSDSSVSSVDGAMTTSELTHLCYPHDLDLSKFVKESTDILDDLHRISREANDQVVQLVASRVGRDLQRYSFDLSGSEDGQSEGIARLTTGTVPILKDGRVL